jgi:hypothetical protein
MVLLGWIVAAQASEACVFDQATLWSGLKAHVAQRPELLASKVDETAQSVRGLLTSGDFVALDVAGCDHLSLRATLVVKWPVLQSAPPVTDRAYWVGRAEALRGLTGDWFAPEWLAVPPADVRETPSGFAVTGAGEWPVTLTVWRTEDTGIVQLERMYN